MHLFRAAKNSQFDIFTNGVFRFRQQVPAKKFKIQQNVGSTSAASGLTECLHKVDNNFRLQGVIHIFHRVINIAFSQKYQPSQTKIACCHQNRKRYFSTTENLKITLHNLTVSMLFYTGARLFLLTGGKERENCKGTPVLPVGLPMRHSPVFPA